MKAKIIMLIDTMCIIITIFYVRYIDNRESYGLAALEDTGKIALGKVFLGVEVLILIIAFIIMIYKKYHKGKSAIPTFVKILTEYLGDMIAKIIMVIDIILIAITTFYVLYINNRESYGMAALGDLGRFILGLGFLGVELLILVIVCIIIIYQKFHKR